MAKQYKVKRYHKIYTSRTRSTSHVVLKIICCVFAVCALGFVGWSVYGPISDFLSGVDFTSPGEEDLQPVINADVLPPSQSEPEPEPEPISVLPQVKAIYFPVSMLTNEEAVNEIIEQIAAMPSINAIMFDLKDTSGNISYQSSLELVAQAQAQVENAFDLEALCKKLTDNGIVPIGRINAFRDPVAASRIPDAGVKYMNSEILWLDNAQENGGKPWLNPYSDLAQAYITDIACESISLGVEAIVLDNVSFPTGYGQEFATYGNTAAESTRSDILASFLDKIEEQILQQGGEMAVYISGVAALGVNNTFYGSNPLALSNTNIILDVQPVQFGDVFALENFTLTGPILTPYETVDGLLKFLQPDLTGKDITAMIQGYTTNQVLTNNKIYTYEDIVSQVEALSANGVDNYILYSPNGSYPAFAG